MIIAIDARKLRKNGIGVYIANLINELCEIDKKNRYLLIANSNSEISLLSNPHDSYCIVQVKSKIFSIWEQFELPWILYKYKADIFHSTHYFLPFIKMCKYIVTIHDLIPILFPEQFSLFKRIYLHLMIKWAIMRANLILSVSKSTKKDITNKYGIKFAEKIKVIYEASGINKYDEVAYGEKVFENYTIIRDKYILYVGLNKKHKNIARLIEAYSIACSQGNIQLVLAGNIKKSEIKNSDIKEVVFTGKVKEDELTALYKNAKIFALVSLYEGFGLPILEAMSFGVPVVTSNLSSMKEIAEDAALLVNPHDTNDIANALNKLIENEDLRNDLIKKGYERVQQFSWYETAVQTLAAYEDVIKNENTFSK